MAAMPLDDGRYCSLGAADASARASELPRTSPEGNETAVYCRAPPHAGSEVADEGRAAAARALDRDRVIGSTFADRRATKKSLTYA